MTVLVLLLALAGAGCVSTTPEPPAPTGPCSFRIAFLGALSGRHAGIAISPRNGAKLAIDRYNAASPECPVELFDADTEGDANKAPAIAQRIVDDPSVLAVVGPAFSGESETAMPTLDAHGVVTITPSATRTSLAEQGWRVFHRAIGNDAQQGPAAGRYIRNVLRSRNVYVIDDSGAYGKGLADEVRKQLGALVIGNATIQTGQKSFATLVADIRALKTETVFFGGYYADAGAILKELRTAGVHAVFVAGDGVWDPGLFERSGTEAAEGAVITCPCLPADQAQGTFFQDFTLAFGAQPGGYAAEGYDAARVLLAGISAGNRTRASLLAFVNAYDGYGITRRLKFDERGELPESSVRVWAYRVRNGQIVPDREIAPD